MVKTGKQSIFILFSFILLLSNLLFGLGTASAAETNKQDFLSPTTKKALDLSDYKDPNEKVRVIIELEGSPAIEYATEQGVLFKDLTKSKQNSLQSSVKEEQSNFLSSIKKEKINISVENTFTVVANGISGEVKASDIPDIESHPDVTSVSIANEYERPEVKPDMVSSGDIVQAEETWVEGYDGTGTVVGIIDTGIDPSHKDMVLTDDSKAALTQAGVESSITKNNLPGKYHTIKVPYGYNYYDKNQEILDLGPDASMHGMHVGGTVGANGIKEKGGIKGIAPETQLLALKVFGNDAAMPSTWGDIYIKAIDDAILLGADVINMSLGSTGAFQNPEDPEQKAIERAVNNGVLMSISAGNSAQFSDGYMNPLTSNPDIGLVGSPSLSKDSVSVASLENTHVLVDEFIFTIGGVAYKAGYKTQASPLPLDVFGKKENEVIYVGNGAPSQYEGKDVKGKIVFAVRNASNPNYGEIQKQAEAADAIGVIIRGTAAHGDFVSMALNSPTIPLVSLRVSDGTKFEEQIIEAGGSGKVQFTGEMIQLQNSTAGQLSTFTSWGVTPNLDFKPEITAPGGKIYSTLNNDKYGVMSGTSMAAPHVSGGSALVLQYVEKTFPQLTGKDKVKRAKTLLLNTSTAMKDPKGTTYYSPRRQGSGVMQINSAIHSPVYVVNKGTDEGKVTLKEITKDKFSFTLTATNYSKKDASYTIDTSVLTDAITKNNEKVHNALTPEEIKKAIVTADKEIKIKAGKSKDFTITIDLKNAKADLEKVFTNGYFVEGFVALKAKVQEDSLPTLSIPFVGFKGDWNKASIIDPMENDDNSFYGATGLADPITRQYYGFDQFAEKIVPERIAFSPNGDGINDTIAPVLSFLRNAKTVEYSIVDTNGNTLRKLTTNKNQRKNYFASSYYTFAPAYTTWDGKSNNKPVAEGSYYYQVKSSIDYEGKEPQVFKMPILVDNTAPTVSKVRYKDTEKTLTFKASDTQTGSGISHISLSVNDKEVANLITPEEDGTYSVKLTGLTYNDADKTPVEVQAGDKISVTAHDYAGNTDEEESKTDHTVPYITSDKPVATGTYDTLTVPVEGYATDDSEVAYVKVEYEGKTKDLTLTWNEEKKRYEFSDVLVFSNEGKQEIRFHSADTAGNKIDFNREIYLDTTAPEIDVQYNERTDSNSQNITVTVSDNYNALRLLVNGDEEINTFIDIEDFPTYGAYEKSKTIQLNLEDGANDFEFVLEDLVGHKVTKTITIHKETTPDIPVILTVDPVYENSKTVTGKAEAGSKVTVKAGKTTLGTATANKNGSFKININKQKAGTLLSVTATDKKGNSSEAQEITVKKKR